MDAIGLRFWLEGGEWRCAIPRNDHATQNGFSWRRFGLIGRGATREAAFDDWRLWKRASDFVASVY